MFKSIRQKLFINFLILITFVTIGAGFISIIELQRYFRAQLREQMQTQINEIAFLLKSPPQQTDFYSYLTQFAHTSNFRITLINKEGKVIFDSQVAQEALLNLDNHSERPEVKQARREGIGIDERMSHTVNTGLYYLAMRTPNKKKQQLVFPDAQVIRLSIPLREVDHMMKEMQEKIIIGGLIAFLVVAIVSFYFAQRITDPVVRLTRTAEKIKQGHFDTAFDYHANDELGRLSEVLDGMLIRLRTDVVQMDRLQKVRSQFLGNVSHELRTPIFTLQGYLETLLESNITDKKKQRLFIEKAFKRAERLNILLTDLIDISRIESGEMKMSFRYFNLQEWLQCVVAELEGKAKNASVNLKLHEDSSLKHVEVLGDKQRLTQVMTNLISNAIKYNKENGRVDVRYHLEQAHIRISVQDTGMGIAEEHHTRLFERFYRVDVQRSRDVGGTGLGLAIVKHIIDAHKGAIAVTSEPGKGSTFSFLLKHKGLYS